MSAGVGAAAALADWGTSRLRLWLIGADGAVLDERRSDDGMLTAQTSGFARILERDLLEMGAGPDLPVMICGMAGARQGWVEAPYVSVPASLNDVLRAAIRVPEEPRDIRIIPGIAQRDAGSPDVMRGEETQLAGTAALYGSGRHIVCMPGTHSKWVEVDGGSIARFRTWMTGELFSVLSRHSILRHSLGEAPAGASETDEAFALWCRESLDQPGDAGALLFRIRAATLLQDLTPDDAAAALSGLLIGAEIGAARRLFAADGREIVVVASGRMGDLYRRAFLLAGLPATIVDAETSVLTGLALAARAAGMIGSPS